MPKNIDDVIMPERRRSIRNIPVPSSRNKIANLDGVKKRSISEKIDFVELPPELPRKVPLPRSLRSSQKRIWISVVTAFIILTFAVLSMFDGATFLYLPKSQTLSFDNETFSATKTGEGGLLYSVVKLSGDKGKSVSVSGEQEVSRKASGVIVIYNDTTLTQVLIENTRFESTAGKVYRIQKAVSIPKKVGTQPGSLEVSVYADVAGDSYNSAPTDFTVPGLKGGSRYTTIYARSKTPITGGFIGKESIVNEIDMEKIRTELKSVLREELLAKAQAEVPSDFILFPSLSTVTIEDLPQTASGNNASVIVNLRGNLYGIMFKKTELTKELSHNKAILQAGEIVELNSFEGLKLSFSGETPTDLLTLLKINFKVNGTALMQWRTDEVALRSDLLGRKEGEITTILKNYPTIASVDIILRPLWKGSFPKEVEKISIRKLKAE